MFEVKILKDKLTAQKIGIFLTSPNAFEQTWAPDEKLMVKEAVLESLANNNHRYWYVEDKGEIVGAGGVRENKWKSKGYEMNDDYIAVHKNYRRRGIASQIFKEIENYVKEKDGRYLHILTCDIDSYRAARNFYEEKGYTKVAKIPDYYVVGEGRVDYFKKFS